MCSLLLGVFGPSGRGLAARAGAIPGGAIRDGGLHIERLAADPPQGADELILDLYNRIPDTRIAIA